MPPPRCFSLVLLPAVLLLTPPATAKNDPADLGGATLPTDPKIKGRLQAAADFIKGEDWRPAVIVLQTILDQPEDAFVPLTEKGAGGKEVSVVVSAHTAANRLLAGLPAAGRKVYEREYGGKAAELLAAGKKEQDREALAEVSQRYLYTEAGPEATERLAWLLHQRGDMASAALAFARLIERTGLEKLEPLTLFRAALVFQGARDTNHRERVWKQLAAKAPNGLRVAGRDFSLNELKQEIDKAAPRSAGAPSGYPMLGGDATRTAQGAGGAPFMQPDWTQKLLIDQQVKTWIHDSPQSAVKMLEGRGHPVLPAQFPVAATGPGRDGKPRSLVIFRSYGGIHAVDANTGKLPWISKSFWSMEAMQADSQKQQPLASWVQWWVQSGKPEVLLENSTVGSLSTDGTLVYAVDDLAVPPGDSQLAIRPGGRTPNEPVLWNQVINDAIQHNKLQAIELLTGRTKWELGGKIPAGEGAGKDPKDLRDSYFLGPPLPLEGRLYFINEKAQQLRLVCFDPGRLPAHNPSAKDLHDAIAWVQPLATAREKITQDFWRRITAAQIAYGEGVLVCPTNAGVILGVDLLGHRLLWANAYREPPPDHPGREIPITWKVPGPVVQDGKVVFTAIDSEALHCLDLRTGANLWRQKRQQGDLYLAGVYAGRVVVVGKAYCRALALADGHELWRVTTGLPSGRGTASDNVYYLPLREEAGTKTPAVVAIDLMKGKVVSRARSRPDSLERGLSAVPGNLTFFGGYVISQNATEVAGLPLLKTKIEQINRLLEKNPNDPAGLYERGELRLDQGNLLGAVEDLRAARANKPEEELGRLIRAKLYEALTQLLQADFSGGEKYLKEYEELSKTPVDPKATPEQQQEQEAAGRQRRATYLMLVGHGYEQQGRLVPALEAYLEFAAQGDPSERLSVVDDPTLKVAPRLWVAGRIRAMLAAARPPSRQLLEEGIDKHWKAAQKANDLDALRRFVDVFGDSRVGREARLALAEQLVAAARSLPEAERQLILLSRQKDDPQKAGQAIEALARLMVRRGLREDAVHYYRVLKTEFAATIIRDGKTGADLWEGITTDKRFLPYLHQDGGETGRSRVKATGEQGNFPMTQADMIYTFLPEGDVLPFFERYRVCLNYNTNHFKLIDRRTGQEKWEAVLRPNNFTTHMQWLNNFNNGNPKAPTAATLGYRTVGHLLVLNLGQVIVGLDPIGQRVLWEKSLIGSDGLMPNNQPMLDADGVLQIVYQDGYTLRLGQSGPVTATGVCLLTQEGLIALDPLTGRTLWTRSDVPRHSYIFGDDQHVFLVELDKNNTPTGTRAFRTQDGAAVRVPDFTAPYSRRLRVMGGVLLLTESTPDAGLTMRLYDVATGKDVWTKRFPAKSVVLRSEEPDLAGAVSPDGKATVVSLRTGKEVLIGMIDPRHLQNVQQAHLLADGQFVYMMFHATPKNDVWSNLQPGTGLRGLPVNGAVYAFDRATGKIKWIAEVENQQLVLEQWKELPVLIFTSRYNKIQGGFWRGQVVSVEIYYKANGKLVFNRPDLGQQVQQFYALNYDPRSGKIELTGHNYKVTLTSE
jgi:outer membrane protein assembly factor BamB